MIKTIFSIYLLLISTNIIAANSSGTGTYYPKDTWRTSTPEEQGIDSASLAKSIHEIVNEYSDVHSLLVIRNGYMVLDTCFYPFSHNTKHDLASNSKSIVSALIGIAIDKGYIGSVNEKIVNYFPDVQIHDLTKEKAAITIKDLLTMKSGLREFQKSDPCGEITLHQMINSPDWLAFEFNLSMKNKPGTQWVYNSEGVYLLSAILSRATNLSALNFAQKHLFSPLGICDVVWPYDLQHRYNFGWGDLRMKPYDMAKIGYLFLQKGNWNGKQVISSEWINESTCAQVKKAGYGNENYGYLWWVSGRADKNEFYSARGRGGQCILVWPEKNIVVVATGADSLDPFVDYFGQYIPKWIKSDKPLSANPKGSKLLKTALMRAQQPKQPVVDIHPLPKIAKLISGKIFKVQGADKKFSFTFTKDNNVIYKEIYPEVNEFHFNIKNIPQKYQGIACIPGLISGYWASDTTFVFDNNLIGNNYHYHYEISFTKEGKAASIKILEKTKNSKKILKAIAVE